MRNTVQALGQYYLGHNTIQGLNNGTVLKKLVEEKNIDWNDIKAHFQRGIAATKQDLDLDVPVFATARNYIEEHVYLNEQNEYVEK